MLLLLTLWLAIANAMTPARIAELREETVAMFYHGFDNYMDIAFPEDEVSRCFIYKEDYVNESSFDRFLVFL